MLTIYYCRLHRMDTSGVLARLEKKWLIKKNIEQDCAQNAQVPLGLRETYTAFGLLALGTLLSVVVACFEYLVHRYKSQKTNN